MSEIVTEQQKADNTMGTLRKLLFEQMISLRNGDSDASEAIGMSKLAHQVIDSYKTEIEAVRVANELKDKNFELIGNMRALG